jgi:large subunit ribosomal protein L25
VISEELECFGVSLLDVQVAAQVRGGGQAPHELGPASWHKSYRCKSRSTTRPLTRILAIMSAQQQIAAAKTLPPRLIRFFQKYPPPALFPILASTTIPSPPAPPASTDAAPTSSTPPSDSDAHIAETALPDLPQIPSTAPQNSRIPAHAHDLPYPNPFLPSKNFTTGRWHGPAFGLRKQADLVKLASQHGVVDLLPWTIKKPGEKEARRIETGLMVKGTGEGQKVKGKSWERTLKGRLEMRRQAMLNMPQMIQEWKQVRSVVESGVTWTNANRISERTRPWMEEVAEWKGQVNSVESFVGRSIRCVGLHEVTPCVYQCTWKSRHINEAFGVRARPEIYALHWRHISKAKCSDDNANQISRHGESNVIEQGLGIQ